MPAKTKFDPAKAITQELIAILEKGTLPWRKPWTVPGSACPLRQTGDPYQGVNNFLLTMRTLIHGYTSPYWMTMRQANALEARIRKGEASSVVVFYGKTYKDGETSTEADKDDDTTKETGTTANDTRIIPFMKSYRVFNADQIEGLPDLYHPVVERAETQTSRAAPIPHMQDFFDGIGADVVITGREANYVPPVDRIYMPEMSLFESANDYYSVLGHEHGHWTKPRHRLNRSYGDARFGNTAYAREEIVADLASLYLGQHLGYAPHTIQNTAAYIDHWLSVLKSDHRAIFALSADAKRASEFLIAASQRGAQDVAA